MVLPSPTVWKGLSALLCGAVVPLGFSPFGFYPIPFVALAVLGGILYSSTARAGLLAGALFGLGQFGVGVSWVHISIHHYGNAGLLLSLATMMLLVLYLSLFPALMGWLVGRLSAASRPAVLLVVFPSAWTLTEWLRAWLFTGFPWLNLGYSQTDSPLIGFAPLVGIYGIGFLTAFCAGLLNCMVSGSGRMRSTAVVLICAVVLAGWGLNQHHWTQASGAEFEATLVQGNIPQELKWKPEQQRETLERYVDLTSQHEGSDLVVWPETAVPAFYDQVETDFIIPLREKMQAKGVSLVTGIPVLDRSQWNYYNAVISLEKPGQFYYKVHLVPFGEYLPLRDWLARALSFLPVPQADFSSGDLRQPLLEAAGYPVGASICYEIAFGEELIHTLPEAAFLINISNDAWFGDSLAPHQHLEMARMRARETERYLLRATNTGISAIINADGKIVAQSRQFEVATVSYAIQPRSGATPYVIMGNWPVITLATVLLALVVWRAGGKVMLSKLDKLAATRWYWLALILLGVSLESIALVYQYVLEYWPCVLCIHVRIWVLALLAAAVVGLALHRGRTGRGIGHALVLSVSIGLLERSWKLLAIERGFAVDGECNFDAGLPDWFALDQWFPAVFKVWEACGYTPELLFGVTMAEALLVLSLVLVAMSTLMILALLAPLRVH